jgi:predicted Fe-S protein YdhL (DUF1289 family)
MTSIATPCRNVCILDPTIGLCRGCGRTLAEIASWQVMTDRQRTEIMMRLPNRLTVIDRGELCEPLD